MATKEKEEELIEARKKKEAELREIALDKSNWVDAAHWLGNLILEAKAPNSLPAKVLGSPLELAKIVGQGAWIASSPDRMAENKSEFEEQANTSFENRLISGYTNTAGNLIGFGQEMKEYYDSTRAASDSERALSQALANQANKLILKSEEQSKFREIDNQKKKVFMDDVFARRDAAEAERVLKAEEDRKKMIEPDPREEAAKIARAIRQQKELADGG